MTILGPLLMASVMILPIVFASMSGDVKKVGIIDESGFFQESFKDSEHVKYSNLTMEIETAKENISNLDVDIILYIPEPAYTYPSKVILYSEGSPGMRVESNVRNQMNDDLRILRLRNAGVDEEVIRKMKSSISVESLKIQEDGSVKLNLATRDYIMGILLSVMIYFFIFMFGSQVMRGVIEEKTNRIIEVIISSVKPFQLMMGKIIGVALVGLTQFALWVVITLLIVLGFRYGFSDLLGEMGAQQMAEVGSAMQSQSALGGQMEQNETLQMVESILNINFTYVILTFLFYFLFGYLLYAALFAAIGSAVDNETDTQQFMLPVTVPLILSIVMAQFIANSPGGSISFWFSIIPLTSPVSMMVRIPFEIPIWEMALSMFLLVGFFVLFTWIASKIYRVGILMYGKKVSYKELWKWIKY
jgi:ABC-2 type transport system permease protein